MKTNLPPLFAKNVVATLCDNNCSEKNYEVRYSNFRSFSLMGRCQVRKCYLGEDLMSLYTLLPSWKLEDKLSLEGLSQ